MQLRPYQERVISQCYERWTQDDVNNVCLVMPTGAGKTKTSMRIVKQRNEPSMVVAHRQELVLQLSEALAADGVIHRIIASDAVVKFCAYRHMELFGKTYVDHTSYVAVAGVQTLIRREDQHRRLLGQMRFWMQDECHHIQPDNQWGRAVQLMPNAQGLGVTATPLRTDRRGLDSVLHALVLGPTMRELINQGFLSDYRIYCPPASVDRASIRVSRSTGEFVQQDLRDATERSTITGDVVEHYMRLAPGKLGLCFNVTVQQAQETADRFNAAGIPAAMLHGGSTDAERTKTLDALKRGDIKMVTNVDIFGEGFDAPHVDVIHMARPTQSYGLYVQQFGRGMRPREGKTHGIIIDHVSNVLAHGLPDAPRQWSLEGREAQQRDVMDHFRVCAACLQPYVGYRIECPHCGFVPEPAERSTPQQVDGDLVELDPAVLARMRGEVINIESGQPAIPYGATGAIIGRRTREWGELVDAQRELRDTIALLAGAWKHGDDLSDREIHRRFYGRFGTTILEACSLRRADAERLTNLIRMQMT